MSFPEDGLLHTKPLALDLEAGIPSLSVHHLGYCQEFLVSDKLNRNPPVGCHLSRNLEIYLSCHARQNREEKNQSATEKKFNELRHLKSTAPITAPLSSCF